MSMSILLDFQDRKISPAPYWGRCRCGRRMFLKLANGNASNWPTGMPQTGQRECLKPANAKNKFFILRKLCFLQSEKIDAKNGEL